jgi:hypothetical protein
MKTGRVAVLALLVVLLCLPVSFVCAATCSDTLQADDGVAEQGYRNTTGTNPGAFCQKFVPCAVPYKFKKFSVGLTTLSGVPTLPLTITMWKNNGGTPGAVMATLNVSAASIPAFPSTQVYTFDLPHTWPEVPATDSSVFLGVQWDFLSYAQTYVLADESVTTTLQTAYGSSTGVSWWAVETMHPDFRSLFFRAEGSNCIDNDGDGYGSNCAAGPDCDDNNSAIHEPVTYYSDADGDGYGNQDNASAFCLLTPPAGYADNSSGFDVNDSDPFLTDFIPTCRVIMLPSILGFLIGDQERSRHVLVIGTGEGDFDEATPVRWESIYITSDIKRVLFKRFMLLQVTIDGENLDRGEYRVMIGDCFGKIKLVR